jgi:hypothetical protein
MADSIPGGATKDAAGAWRNAAGLPLDGEQVAKAEEFARKANARKAEAERMSQQAALASNPALAQLSQALGMRAAPARVEEPRPTEDEGPSVPRRGR